MCVKEQTFGMLIVYCLVLCFVFYTDTHRVIPQYKGLSNVTDWSPLSYSLIRNGSISNIADCLILTACHFKHG